MRIGHGYDVHRFGGEGPIIIGGVSIDYEHGLIAHSDGDVLIHAVCDALLGAVGLGDIGTHFPDTDTQYENINSRELLKRVVDSVHEAGFKLSNLDCTIIAQAPKMMPFVRQMRTCLAQDLACDINQVNVKATTTEKLGFTGRKEGIACHAVVLLKEN